MKEIKGISMISEAEKAAFKPHVAVQCVIFAALFMSANVLQNIVLFIPLMLNMMFNREEVFGFLFDAEGGFAEQINRGTAAMLELPGVLPTMLFSSVFIIAVFLIYGRFVEKRSMASFGLRKKGFVRSYAIGAGVGILFLAAVYLTDVIVCGVEAIRFNGFDPVVILLLFGYMIQSAGEEIMMRGFLMNSVAAKSGSLSLAIILNSLIFAALHLANPGVTVWSIANIAIIGVTLSLLALIFDNIAVSCGMHFSWNFALGCIMGCEVSGMSNPSLFTILFGESGLPIGSAFGKEGDADTTVIGLIIMIICAAVLVVKRSRARSLEAAANEQ